MSLTHSPPPTDSGDPDLTFVSDGINVRLEPIDRDRTGPLSLWYRVLR